MMSPPSEKATRYINLLDAARCNGNWPDVPELVRKVKKHAPARQCLILTASSELEVVKHVANSSSSRGTKINKPSSPLCQLVPPLLSVVDSESTPAEDAFQGRTCLATINWTILEYDLAVSRLSKNVFSTVETLQQEKNGISDYTNICLLRAWYMKATSGDKEGDAQGTLEISTSAISWLRDNGPNVMTQPLLLLWSEQLLAQMASAACDDIDLSSTASRRRKTVALQAFRQWAVFACRSRDRVHDDFGLVKPVKPKIEIWRSYYLFLSKLVQLGVDIGTPGERSTRIQQAGELRRVEATYEQELLQTTKFPKANESNLVMEQWIEQVIRNWETLCGRSWSEVELGEGGRNAVGRNVLDILYRAATKTFHSTLILRRLFQLHKALAEFDLAYRAFDSYLELVSRAKSRASLSRVDASGIDSDAIVLATLSEAVEGLCTFGRRAEAEKALKLTQTLETWIKDFSHSRLEIPTSSSSGLDDEANAEDARTFEIAHRAIGVGKAFWARWTPVSESRSKFQTEALASLNKAAEGSERALASVETLYAFALLLAQTRDINKAVETIRKGLSMATTDSGTRDSSSAGKAMSFLHLLALVLSSRQDFQNGYQICGAAFDRLNNSDDVYSSRTASRSTLASTDEKVPSRSESRINFDELDVRQLQRIVEIRVTELALVEIVEGPEEALGESDQLLSLFSKLFGHLGIGKDEKPRKQSLMPPKSSAGTVKSFRGSIFGRKHRQRPESVIKEKSNGVASQAEAELERQSTRATEAPTIQITDEDSVPEKGKSRHFRRSFSNSHNDSPGHKLHRREGSKSSHLEKHDKGISTKLAGPAVSSQRTSLETDHEKSPGKLHRLLNSTHGSGKQGLDTQPSEALKELVATRKAQVPISSVAHNQEGKNMPPPVGHEKQPPEQDTRLPVASIRPATYFPRAAEQIHGFGVLVKVWLFVGSLYRRAVLYEDSKEACDEAARSASQIEALVASQESSASAFADPGWGGGKSLNEIWADVHTERGYLDLARGMPHDAIKQFEEALAYAADHPKATIGLSNLLLDVFEQKIPSERPKPGIDLEQPQKPLDVDPAQLRTQAEQIAIRPSSSDKRPTTSTSQTGEELRKTPANLNRLAARDRAYGLLSNLTKLGSSWDDSEAWYALARAHECSGQMEKAREVLWFCVELEETRPVRAWSDIGPGGHVL